MIYELPETVEIGGKEYPIMWDYRPILDIMCALSDPELNEQDRIYVALYIFYPTLEEIPHNRIQEAVEQCFWFVNGGADDNSGKKQPKLMDWDQDFNLIASPVNRVLGKEIRSKEKLHWFSFLSAYSEIGDCTFAQAVRIRDMKLRGKKMDKQDREWYNRNRELVDFKRKYTESDNDLFKEWGGV